MAIDVKSPRAWFRLDRVWYIDKKYRKASHGAILLHIGLIGLSVNNSSNGIVDLDDAETVGININLDFKTAWSELLESGLIVFEKDQYKIPNFERWQTTPEQQQRLTQAASAGGKKSAEMRKLNRDGMPASSDGFDLESGFYDALKAYPKGFSENMDKMRLAYIGQVKNKDDHDNVMRGIKHFAEMFEMKSKLEGKQKAIQYRVAFSNFLSRGEFDQWQTSRLEETPDAEVPQVAEDDEPLPGSYGTKN